MIKNARANCQAAPLNALYGSPAALAVGFPGKTAYSHAETEPHVANGKAQRGNI
jgi:hypothetical protein